MELFSRGDFYLGMDEEKFCDFDIHVGRFVIQYTCPAGQSKPPKDDGASNRPMEGPTDG
jgi:hypothetical protein